MNLSPHGILFALVPALVGCGEDSDRALAPGTVLRRLDQRQLDNTLRDLLQRGDLPAVELPPESTDLATPHLVESLHVGLDRVARHAVAYGRRWLPCPDDPACAGDALATLAHRAFRRPLTTAEDAWLAGVYDGSVDHGAATAAEMTLTTILSAPDFLYLLERGNDERSLDDWEIASRLSYFLWDSMPDAELFEAAAAGELHAPERVREEATRMLADARAREAILGFHRGLLAHDAIAGIDLDATTYIGDVDPDGELDPDDEDELLGELMSEFRLTVGLELDHFVEDTLVRDGTLEGLLTSRRTWVSPSTAPIYGVRFDHDSVDRVLHVIGDEDFEIELVPVELPAERRAGFLTGLAFLAVHAHPVHPSPVERAVFVRERLLCRPPAPPPDDVGAVEEGSAEAPRTNRERYEQHVSNPACAGCHVELDGVGFPFEHYDSMGRYRTHDNGEPVDASGVLLGSDVDGPVSNAVELAERLAVSRTVHDCFVTQWFRHALARTERDEDAETLERLRDSFWASGGRIHELLLDLVTSEVFLGRQP
jgi:hypothetical protein